MTRRAFTLIELLTVVVIITILVLLTLPAIGWYKDRTARLGCTNNLKTLYSGMGGYLSASGTVWPQIKNDIEDEQGTAKLWYETLRPYGVGWKNWACPSLQIKLKNPDISDPKFHRLDYAPMRFDSQPGTPLRWPSQPWFAEKQGIHGGGNLLILTDGSVIDLNTAKKRASENRP